MTRIEVDATDLAYVLGSVPAYDPEAHISSVARLRAALAAAQPPAPTLRDEIAEAIST